MKTLHRQRLFFFYKWTQCWRFNFFNIINMVSRGVLERHVGCCNIDATWGVQTPCIQRTSNRSRCMPDLESQWLTERLAYLGRSLSGDAVCRQKASRTFSHLQSDPKAESWRWSMGQTLFVCECRKALRNLPGSSDLSQSWKELYQELVVGSASDPLSELHGWAAEEVRSHWNWAPGSSFLNNS